MNTLTKSIAGGTFVGGLFLVGYLATSAQYVPPVNRANTVATSAPCSPGERPEWDGSAWQCRIERDNRSKTYCLANEYTSVASAVGDQGSWSPSASGTNATNALAASAVRGSIVTAQTGSTTTGRAGFVTSPWVLPSAYVTSTLDTTLGIGTLSTSSEEFSHVIGAIDVTTSPTQTNGCGVLYDRGNVATGGANSANANVWECFCASGGSRTYYPMNGVTVSDGSFTTVNTPVAVASLSTDSNMIAFRLVWTGTSLFEVYANTGSGYTKRCQITSNISGVTSPLRIGHNSLKSAGTTDIAAAYTDREQYCWTLNAARSP